MGAMQVVVMGIMPITVRRTPPLIAQADPDLLKVYLVCDGNSSVVAQDGRQAELSAGEFAFYDTRRPCRRDLSDPVLAARPVAAIAARWGFSSASDFSRVFRAVHGLPPTEYRMSARIVKESAR